MNKSLYQIQEEYQQIVNQLLDNGGEITDELEQSLAISQHELTVKGTNYALVIREFEGKEAVIDAEIERLTKLKRVFSNSADRLKHNIKAAMEAFGVDKIEGEIIKLSLAKIPASVEIKDENLIPKFLKTEVPATWKPDKKAIKEVLESGETVLGAELITGKKRLVIK